MQSRYIIKTKGLSKDFKVGFRKKKKAIDNIDLSVEEGEIFGFIGPNGAGKTTTLKILMGLIYPGSGDAWIFGRDIRDIKVKRDIGFLPENPYFYDYLTAKEFLYFYGQLFSLGHREITGKIDELLDILDIKEAKNSPLRGFSKGMLQRIGIAQAMINDPRLVILDEPMSGLDPIGRLKIRDIILHLRDMGKTVFFSSHILSDVEMVCDRVGILFNGKLKDIGKLDNLLSDTVKSIEITVSGVEEDLIPVIEKYAGDIVKSEGKFLITANSEEKKNKILKIINENHGNLISLIPRKETLEDLFMRELNREE